MALPSIVSTRRQRKQQPEKEESPSSASANSPGEPHGPSPHTLRAATRTRLIFSLLTSFLFLLALVFLILVEVGSTSDHHAIVGSIYFLKLDLSHIIPQAVPQATLINSIARTLGLHDFYQVGLWNFCEGYGSDISDCGKPKTLYWFDPVHIILNELLSGAIIALPANIISALFLVRLASHWMFALFFTGACTCFVSIFLTPLSIFTRWATFPIAIFAFLSALTTTVATVVATVMFIIFKNVIRTAEVDVNIVPEIGVKMFVFMWIASGSSIIGWLVQMGMCCCCASRRDVKLGKKMGRKSAWSKSGETPLSALRQHERRGKRGLFGRKKQ